MKILVYGAGAVGSLIGGLLSRTGNDVTLLGRKPHIDEIARTGLFIKGIWGEYRIKSLEGYTRLSDIPAEKNKFDLVLLTVKSFDTENACREIKEFFKEVPTILAVQNGLGNIETLTKYFNPENLFFGRIITGIEIEPGTVKVTVSADDIVIGQVGENSSVAASARIVNLLKFARMPVRTTPDIERDIWMKAIYNCALNASCSLLKIPYGKLPETPDGLNTIREIVTECYAVAKSRGIHLVPETPEEYLKLLLTDLIPKTAQHFPSMLRDLQHSRPTEITSLNAAIEKFGRVANIPTSKNSQITAAIQMYTKE